MTIATQATLAALLAKVIAAPATEAKQDTGNTSLGTIATNTTGLATASAQATAATTLSTIATNTSTNATAAGQSSANTKLDTLHTDLTAGLVTIPKSVTVTGSITAANGTVDGTLDLSGYSAVRVQLTGTFAATIAYEVSNDGTNWFASYLLVTNINGPGNSNGGTSALAGPITGKFFRARASSFTSGTATLTIVYSAAAPAQVPANAVQLNGGTNVVGGVYIGNGSAPSAFSTTSAATTNATSVKASAGTLFEFTVSNPTATAAYFKLYNKASAPTVGTDIPVATYRVAATGSAGDTVIPPIGANGKRFTTGIAWALTAAAAATDTAASVAGIQIHGTYV
jgi:hypothetical protein